MTCSRCQRAIHGEYFSVNGQTHCAECATQVRRLAVGAGFDGAASFAKAALFGLGAAIVGAAVYAGIKIIADTEWALATLAIGWLVGKAVRFGSGNRGGRDCQVLALFLTYSSVSLAYAVIDWNLMGRPAGEFTRLLLTMYALPFMGGAQSLVGWLIIAMGFLPAWKTNQRQLPAITGPHTAASAVAGL